jgi:hypothetical protein
MRKPVRRGLLLGLTPLGLLACGAQIDDFAHESSAVKRKVAAAAPGPLHRQELRRHGGSGSPPQPGQYAHPRLIGTGQTWPSAGRRQYNMRERNNLYRLANIAFQLLSIGMRSYFT